MGWQQQGQKTCRGPVRESHRRYRDDASGSSLGSRGEQRGAARVLLWGAGWGATCRQQARKNRWRELSGTLGMCLGDAQTDVGQDCWQLSRAVLFYGSVRLPLISAHGPPAIKTHLASLHCSQVWLRV